MYSSTYLMGQSAIQMLYWYFSQVFYTFHFWPCKPNTYSSRNLENEVQILKEHKKYRKTANFIQQEKKEI